MAARYFSHSELLGILSAMGLFSMEGDVLGDRPSAGVLLGSEK